MPRWTQMELLTELEPVVGRELDRHLRSAREWFPHEYVPWSDGRNFDGVLDGDAWDQSQSRVSEVARTALVVNLLTEDNLPSYHRDIYESFGTDGAWGTWIGRWTAEEGRHGIAIRDYLLTTRAVDPVSLERERMVHMTQGFASSYELDMLHTVAYVSFPELATRIPIAAPAATPRIRCVSDARRIAQDENLHMVFYRNLVQAALELLPMRRCGRSVTSSAHSRCPVTPLRASLAARCRSRWPASTTCGSTGTRCWLRSCAPGMSGIGSGCPPRGSRRVSSSAATSRS